jgi:hypothetical protein
LSRIEGRLQRVIEMSNEIEGFRSVVTFERDTGDPVVARDRIAVSDVADAARRAVFRALSVAPRTFQSVVVVLDRLPLRRAGDA